MFNPKLYERVKYRPIDYPAHISLLPDGRNYIVSLEVPENFKIKTANGKEQFLPDIENGHHMGLVTQTPVNSNNTYPQIFFKTVLENAALGKRGTEVFQLTQQPKILPLHISRHFSR